MDPWIHDTALLVTTNPLFGLELRIVIDYELSAVVIRDLVCNQLFSYYRYTVQQFLFNNWELDYDFDTV